MIFLKTPPIGVDIPIQYLQQALFDQLKVVWNIGDADYNCYGRAYRNQKEDGYIPEVFTGGKEYKEVYVDDKIAALSFFGVSGGREIDFSMVSTDAHLIFFVDLPKLRTVAWRPDEEARMDVYRIIDLRGVMGWNLTSMTTGIDNVFREYTGYRSVDSIKIRDMHPFHCFRFDFELKYDKNFCSFPLK